MMGGLRFFSIDSDITQGSEDAEIHSLSEFAVLCRVHHQARVLEKAFHDHSIPYQTVGGIPFFRQEPMCKVIDMLNLAVHSDNEYLRSRLIDTGRIKTADMDSLTDMIKASGGVASILSKIIDLYFQKEKSEKEILFQKCVSSAQRFGDDLEGFLAHAVLGTSVDDYRPNTETVTLMTLHAAKGLEFDCVFIAGCEDGLIPYSLFDRSSDVDEERRLLYVGMTRAKKHLFLSYAQKRFLMGREVRLPRSPFLDRIQEELIERSKTEYQRKPKREDNQLGLF
jgi:superfamily I DNA/RNA helicase